MAAPANGQEFFELLEKSQLLDAEVIAKLRPQMQPHGQTEAKRLATTLLKNQLITEYQAKQMLAGKYKGFYLARYKILELLGAGGMGRVYLSEQLSMERLVAIKLISLPKSKKRQEQALARFKREAKAVATLRHPNIIQAFDFAEEHGMPYIVMEYIEGMDTAKIVQKFGPIPWKQVAEYGRQAAEGLEHAHMAGLVHRDIKPGNLLVDSKGQVKILDLGLVSAFDEKSDDSLTVDQDQLGTVDYIAPEQALDSKNVDARADIYSLGATLYSIMTGRILYPDKTTTQKLLLHQTTDPEPITNLVKNVPPELAGIIGKMLAKKPDERYQSAQEVAAALKTFAEPKSPPYELSAIKYRRAFYEEFLGKSPEPNQITVPTLGSPEVDKSAATPQDGASSSSGKLRQASMINAGSSDPVLDDFTMTGDDYTQLAMEMPSLVERKKKRKGKKKSNRTQKNWLALGGVVLGLMGTAWLTSITLRAMGKTDEPSFQPTQASTTTPSPEAAKPPTPPDTTPPQPPVVPAVATPTPPQPAGPPPQKHIASEEISSRPILISKETASEETWRGALFKTLSDPDLLVCYTFDESSISGDIVKNQARSTTGKYDLKLVGPKVSNGRFPGKKSIRFNPAGVPHRAEISPADSEQLQLEDRFTIALWFKIDTFHKMWQTLIAKGDSGWRVHRNQETNRLALHVSTADNSIYELNGSYVTNDTRWHQIVCVNSPQSNSMKIYMDGFLDIEMPGTVHPAKNPFPVWMGEGSEPGKGNRSFDGWIDEVAIWKRDLDVMEVKRMFTSGNPAQ